MSDAYEYPVALSRLGSDDSRDAQNTRALSWIAAQGQAPLVIVTPRRDVPAGWLKRAASAPGTTHLTWRGLSVGALTGHRVIHAWPDRQHLNDLWDVDAAALVVIEWGEPSTADWIIEASPDLLLPNQTTVASSTPSLEPVKLPDDVDAILQSVAGRSSGYSGGLKWNEEDKLKADMTNRPARWQGVTVDQLRARCRELSMTPNDIDTIGDFLQPSTTGGWIERDTTDAPLDPSNANRYAYAADDPINGSDPTGRYYTSTIELCAVVCINGGVVYADGHQGYTYGVSVGSGGGASWNGMYQSGSGLGGSKTRGGGCSVGPYAQSTESPLDSSSSGGDSYGVSVGIPPSLGVDCSYGVQYSYAG